MLRFALTEIHDCLTVLLPASVGVLTDRERRTLVLRLVPIQAFLCDPGMARPCRCALAVEAIRHIAATRAFLANPVSTRRPFVLRPSAYLTQQAKRHAVPPATRHTSARTARVTAASTAVSPLTTAPVCLTSSPERP